MASGVGFNDSLGTFEAEPSMSTGMKDRVWSGVHADMANIPFAIFERLVFLDQDVESLLPLLFGIV